jgi:hypothetical protein
MIEQSSKPALSRIVSILITAVLLLSPALAVVVTGTTGTVHATNNPVDREANFRSAVVELTSGEQYCLGEQLHFETVAQTDGATTFHITQRNTTGDAVTVSTNETGDAVINTSRLSGSGEYILRNSAGEPLVVAANGTIIGPKTAAEAEFSVVNCRFRADIGPDIIGIDHPGQATNITVSATLTDAVILSTPQIPDPILADMVGGYRTPEGVRVSVSDDERIPVRITPSFTCQVGAGEYSLTVECVRTGAQRTISFSAATGGPIYARFRQNAPITERGTIARIPVTITDGHEFCPGRDTVTLLLDSNESDYQFRTLLVDRDNDGVVQVHLDTARAGTRLDDEVITASGNDTLRNTTLVQAQATSGMEPGTYDMRLIHNGSEVSAGQLLIESNETTTPTTTITTAPVRSTTTQTPDTESVTPMLPTTSVETGPGFGMLVGLISLMFGFGWIALRT